MSQATAARPAPVRRAPRGANPTASRTRLKLVQPVEAASSGVGFVVLCATLVVGGLITVLLLNTARAQQQYTITDLQNASSRLSATQQDLDSRLTYARAPQQVALKAQEYGMVPATNIRYVRASDHRLVGVAKGTAATSPFTVSTLPKTPATPMADLAVTTANAAGLVESPKDKAAREKAAQNKANKSKQGTDSKGKNTKSSTTPTTPTTSAKGKGTATGTASQGTGSAPAPSAKATQQNSASQQTKNNTTSPSPTSAR